MREILFRGKRKDSGEWVEGVPIKNKLGVFICYEKNPHYCSQYYYMEIQDIAEVIPETVGQFTGLSDKNGIKIFENDIVKYVDTLHKVVFYNKFGNAYFGIVMNNRNENEIWNFCSLVPADKMLVIGNIFDNPELLKGGAEE